MYILSDFVGEIKSKPIAIVPAKTIHNVQVSLWNMDFDIESKNGSHLACSVEHRCI